MSGTDKSLVVCESAKVRDPFGELAGPSRAVQLQKGLARSICSKLKTANWRAPKTRSSSWKEGNVFVRVQENVRGRDVFIVQGSEISP